MMAFQTCAFVYKMSDEGNCSYLCRSLPVQLAAIAVLCNFSASKRPKMAAMGEKDTCLVNTLTAILLTYRFRGLQFVD